MFAAWGSWVARYRRWVLIGSLLAVTAAGVWGVGVFGRLAEGGYSDPGSESARAADVVRTALGAQGGDVVVIYTPVEGGIDDSALAERVRARLDALPHTAVTATDSYFTDRAARYAAADRTRAVAVLTLAGADDSAKLEAYRAVDDQLGVEGATVQLAGAAPLNDASATRSARDLAIAEAISLPIVLLLLLLIFGSLVAAALPVLVGGAAVLGSLGVLHAITLTHDVNSFAVNVASLLGLGMAIDYGLFMVGRFREELAAGHPGSRAVTRTVATAGRTVLFSATLLMIALAGLLLFPQGFLKSLAYGGLAAVALAAVLSLTLLPALLAVLGPNVDRLPVRLPRRADRTGGTFWGRLAAAVLRRPVLVAVPLLAGLLLLAAPIAGVTFGEQDERVLPAGDPARQAVETLKTDFPALSTSGVQVVLRGAVPPAGTEQFTAAVGAVPGVGAVTPAGAGNGVQVFTATLADADPYGTEARDAVEAIRAMAVPAGAELLVGGATARNVDSLDATADRLPLMIALLTGATLLLMFLAFGSVQLPVKAVAVSALSLSATFGILVWIFQEGHGAGLLDVTPAPLEAGIVVLMAAVVFGLSTDYEVFLLSRMVEARTRGATTAEAVTTGLARTGRVISAAALLLIVVTGAFALSSITTMRFVGVGMIIALVLDATVVRMLLVPAVLGLLGDAAWWAPGPLRRLQERAGLAEHAAEETTPAEVSVGRHAAPGRAQRRSSSGRSPRHALPDDAAPGLAGPGARPVGASGTAGADAPGGQGSPAGDRSAHSPAGDRGLGSPADDAGSPAGDRGAGDRPVPSRPTGGQVGSMPAMDAATALIPVSENASVPPGTGSGSGQRNAAVQATGNAPVPEEVPLAASEIASDRTPVDPPVLARGNAPVPENFPPTALGTTPDPPPTNVSAPAPLPKSGNVFLPAPGNASVSTPGNASAAAPATASVPAPGGPSVSMPGNASVAASGDASVQAPGNASVPAPGDTAVLRPAIAPDGAAEVAAAAAPRTAPVPERDTAARPLHGGPGADRWLPASAGGGGSGPELRPTLNLADRATAPGGARPATPPAPARPDDEEPEIPRSMPAATGSAHEASGPNSNGSAVHEGKPTAGDAPANGGGQTVGARPTVRGNNTGPADDTGEASDADPADDAGQAKNASQEDDAGQATNLPRRTSITHEE